MPRIPAIVPAAMRTALLVWGFEIVTVRVTSAPLAVRDIVESLLLWALLSTAAAVWARLFPPPSKLHSACSVLGWAVPVGLAAAILVPVAIERSGIAVGVVLVLLVVTWAVGARRTCAAGSVFPSAPAILSMLLAATAATWLLDPDPLPEPSLVVGAAVVWCMVGFRARTPRWLAVTAVLGVIVASLTTYPASSVHWSNTRPAPEAPDIILISIDTLRADVAVRMHSYARLARHGLSFANVQSAAPWTLPSMATVMSGQPIPVHGAMITQDPGQAPVRYAISPSVPLLAERLSAHGYDTAAVIAQNFLLVPSFGFARGFSFYQHAEAAGSHPLPRGMTVRYAAQLTMTRLLNSAAYRLPIPGAPTQPGLFDAKRVVDDALRILRRRRDRPLFLWLHFMDCHLPYGHHPEISRALDAARKSFERSGVLSVSSYPPEQREAAWKAYVAESRYLDGQLDRLLDAVMPPAKARDSLIVFLADHGEEFFEHGAVGHGHSLYQELLSVPLILSGAPVRDRAGTVVETVVGTLDVAPTLLAAAGAPDHSLPGQNLLGLIQETDYIATSVGSFDRWSERLGWYARRRGQWKAIVHPGLPTELYDLATDSGETHNLAEALPEMTARLSRPSSQVADFEPPRHRVNLSPGEIERLRALGYVTE